MGVSIKRAVKYSEVFPIIRFCYPSKNYGITVLAKRLMRHAWSFPCKTNVLLHRSLSKTKKGVCREYLLEIKTSHFLVRVDV